MLSDGFRDANPDTARAKTTTKSPGHVAIRIDELIFATSSRFGLSGQFVWKQRLPRSWCCKLQQAEGVLDVVSS
jgi:hypothetical protein